MNLFEEIKNIRYELQEVKRKQRDNSYLFDDDPEFDKIKKPTKKANKEMLDGSGKSAVRDAKKYASGEYPKIGGGQRIGSKSKGSGAETGAKVNLNPTSGSKSKGTTPVKVKISNKVDLSKTAKKPKKVTNRMAKTIAGQDIEKMTGDKFVGGTNLQNTNKKRRQKLSNTTKGGPVKVTKTKPVKQSEISKQAKKFTKKINQKNINRPEGIIGDTYVSTDKKGNIRSAKKVNPTLKKSVSQVKADIEFKQGIQQSRKLSGSKGTGELSDKAPQNVRDYVKKVRDKRIKDLKLPDTSFDSKTKFSQKQFNKTIKSRGVKVPQVPLFPDPFGKGDTKGMMNVKDMGRKAFKKTQPKDVKLPKSFTDFSKKLKTLKKDVAKTASVTPRTIPKKLKPSTTVKQSEVSKQAKDFTKKVNQARTKKVTPTTITSEPKKPNVFKRVTAATSGKKVTNSKGIGNQFRGAENKAAKDARINLDRASSGMGGGKPPKPPGKGGTLGFLEPDDTPKPKRVVTKQTRLLQSGQQKFAKSALGKGLRKNLPQVYKGVRSLGPAGRAFAKTGVIGGAATIGTAFLAKNLLKKAAIGGVAGGIIGGAAASQKMSDKERIKRNLPAKLEKDKSGKDIKTVTRMNLNLSDVNKKKKDKGRTPQSIATEVDYLKKRQKVAPYGAKYTG